MKKSFTLLEGASQEEYFSIFAIGLLECLKKNIIDTDRAEQWLFSPVVAYSIKKDFSKQFIYAMEYASELDACKNSEYYQDSIISAMNSFCEVLRNNTNLSTSTSPLKMLIDYKI